MSREILEIIESQLISRLDSVGFVKDQSEVQDTSIQGTLKRNGNESIQYGFGVDATGRLSRFNVYYNCNGGNVSLTDEHDLEHALGRDNLPESVLRAIYNQIT